MWHPWQVFGGLSDWQLRWEQLPSGTWGQTCFATKTVTLTLGMNQAERRCTIAHETQHVLRGPVAPAAEMREELLIDRSVSRLLLPSMRQVVDALVWARGDYEQASEELWVDPLMLEVRLSALWSRERDYYRRRMADVMLDC